MAGTIAKEDAVLVKQLRLEGAIPIVKANIPQMMMAMSSFNEIYGLCKNPYDPNRSSGGSSGGDGGLVGARCVPFGIGTDVGGSIRAPSSYNGVFGFKPSAKRTSFDNMIGITEEGIAP
jgi:Asp-tRNA(Asn)/Glu-tRNA(Gln) amidotransferase A subunit family amidase